MGGDRAKIVVQWSPMQKLRAITLSIVASALAVSFLAQAAPPAARSRGQEKAKSPAKAAKPALRPPCAADNGGLTVPEGFCALVVAEGLGNVRNIAIASNGDVFAALSRADGGFYVLHDSDGDGRADKKGKFGDMGGTGIAIGQDAIYFAPDDRVLRYPWKAGALEPDGPAETIVTLPAGGHSAKPFVLSKDGGLFVDIGSRTNSCQEGDRKLRSPGIKNCPELLGRAGIWRFDANKRGQAFSDGKRWATGLRNAMALVFEPGTGKLFMTTHGRDQLSDNWGFSKEDNAENPAEEFGPVPEGADYGWPYCYYDPRAKKKVLMPEYGGDGKKVADCDKKTQPAIGFPAHYAPLQAAFQTSGSWGDEYRGGMFLAFHGSWNRAPLPQAGYRIVFVPFKDGVPTGAWKDFAMPSGSPTQIRPSGLAFGPDGSLFIAGDANGKIWRVLKK